MNAELESRFNRTFTEANTRINALERNLRSLDRLGRGGSGGGGFGSGIVSSLAGIGKAAGVAAGVGLAGGVLVAGAAVTNSIEKAMNFESQISTIAALTGASNEEMAKMQALALKMGASTKYSALEAAQGIEELLKAGLSPAAVQTGGLEAALNLATAGGLELASAAEIMSTALNAFKRDGMTAAEAADILAGTANTSATDVEELRYSLSMVSAVAAGVGMSFKDTNTALGLFANNGLKGSDAGTSLKTMLLNLIPQTKEETVLFKKLGIVTAKGSNSFFDAAGNIKDLADIAGILQTKLKNLTKEQRLSTLENMFGTDAIRAANILYEEGAAGVEKFSKEMTKVTALDVARKKMDNAAGAVEQFKGALETLQISALLPTMPIIKDLASAAADVVANYTPQITAGMERMVNGARDYVNNHFLQNPEFKKLQTFESKVDFIFNDVMKSFNSWWGSSGRGAFEKVTEEVVGVIMSTLEASVPEMTQIGLKMGSSLAAGITKGIFESDVGKVIRKYTPVGWAYDGLRNVYGELGLEKDNPLAGQEKGEPYKPTATYNTDPVKRVEQLSLAKPKLGMPTIPGYAKGGFTDTPSIFGEAGLEVAIPIDNSARSKHLWETTGRAIGAAPAVSSEPVVNGGDFHYNPTFIINGPVDRAEIDKMDKDNRREFERQFNAHKAQQRRLAFE